ncbi:MAG: TauD/TfdA family dioxygenase [Deltaproteobacteria bacterium]|nr:TauD/TfdA family dioxygenase [Deltaproteobacteria bacterium]
MRSDVEHDAGWVHHLRNDEHAELVQTVARLRGRRPGEVSLADLPSSGPLAEAARTWRREVKDGRGFVLVRGVDVDAFTSEDLELAFVAMGLHFGTLVPQNLAGELITHVRDTGADPGSPSTRLYTTRAEQDFHTDGADVIGLLCRRTARSGGESRIVSSGAIVAEIARSRPDLYPVLFQDFPWHYQEAGMPALWFGRPICTIPSRSKEGARLNTFFIPWYIRRSQELPDAPRLCEAQREVIALVEQLANDPRFYVDMTFEPGDVQWLKNAAILHKRTAYEDHEEPDRRRHLLRLWMSAPDFEDGSDDLRHGVREEAVR